MDIFYSGEEKFKLKGKLASVLMSQDKILVEGTGEERQFEGPGEFESKGVVITGIKRDGKIIYHINFEGMGVVYLKENNLTEEECEQIDQTDILILGTNSPKNIAALEPKIIILKDTGAENETPVNKLSISKEKLPEEPQTVVLK